MLNTYQKYNNKTKIIFQNFLIKTRYPYWAQLIVWAITAICLLLILVFCMVDNRQNLNLNCIESLNKAKKSADGQIKRLDSGLSGKGIITEIDVSMWVKSIFLHFFFFNGKI